MQGGQAAQFSDMKGRRVAQHCIGPECVPDLVSYINDALLSGLVYIVPTPARRAVLRVISMQ